MKRMKQFLTAFAAIVLSVVLCAMALPVGALTVGEDGVDEDSISLYQILPGVCPHEGMGDVAIIAMPTETEAGKVGQLCAVCGTAVVDVELPILKINTVSLSLTDSLVMNYKVSKATLDCEYYSDPHVTFVLNGNVTVVTDYTLSGDYYVFSFENIAPHLMGANIQATLSVTCNETRCAGPVLNYSVKEYCEATLAAYSGEEHAELRTLLVDLLNYGAAAQLYSDTYVDELVNADLSAEQAAWGTSENRALSSVLDTKYVERENATVKFLGVGLSLRDSVTIRYKINAANAEGLSAKVISSNGIHVISGGEFEATEGGYYIYFDWLTAAQMSEAMYITVYDGETAVSNTMRYSVESYAFAKQHDADEKLVDLVLATVRYGDSAKAYANKDVTAPEEPEGGWTDNDKNGWTGSY